LCGCIDGDLDVMGAGGVRVGAGGAGHRHHALDAEQVRQLDGAAQVGGVLGADAGQWVERVAVAVEAGQLHAAGGVLAEVVGARLRRGEQRVDGAVGRRDEPAGVDLDRCQAVGLEHVEGFAEGTVVQARV
jgi:hypothetical protein